MPEKIPTDTQEVPLTLSGSSPPVDGNPARQQIDVNAYLANERTYLAWSLMAIVIIGSGVAMARTLIALNRSPLMSKATGIVPSLFYPTTMGLLFLGAGLLVIATATYRYLSVQKQITQQRYRPSDTLAMMLLAIVLALSVLLVGFLLQLREGNI